MTHRLIAIALTSLTAVVMSGALKHQKHSRFTAFMLEECVNYFVFNKRVAKRVARGVAVISHTRPSEGRTVGGGGS